MLGQGEALKHLQPRFSMLFYLIFTGFCLLSLRLVKLQVIDGPRYRAFSQRNSLRKDKLPGPRGQIFDRESKILVDNRLQLDVVITPQFVLDAKSTIHNLAKIAGIDEERLHTQYLKLSKKSPRFQALTLIPNASRSIVAQVESSRDLLSGVNIKPILQRSYLQHEVGAQVFGYMGEVNKRDISQQEKRGFEYEGGDLIGRAGLEKQWERYLRGRDGVRFVIVNAHGHMASTAMDSADASLLSFTKDDVPPRAGNNLQLTLDSDLQTAAWEAMEGKMGATVALDPRTGEVLAMVSKPSYDATALNLSDDDIWQGLFKNPYGPLRNKAIHDHFSPGSTFKVFTALSAMENEIITQNSVLTCPPIIRFGRRPYHEHNPAGFGKINVTEAIMRSSNVFLWQLAMKLDVNQIADVATSFGFGQKTGIDLPGEIPGLMPTREWKQKTQNKEWYPGETLSVSIGQGSTLTTPLQLALSYSAIANGGLVYQPYLVSKITDIEDKVVKEYKPKLLSKRDSANKHLEAIRKGLWRVVNEKGGTAYWTGRLEEVEMAGKSGTVQVSSNDPSDLFKKCELRPFDKRHHSWFVGFAPWDNPEIVVATFILHGCGGSRNSAPVVKEVVKRWWDKKKDLERLQGPQPASTR
ncbi:penicillin-binding protein 2 [bacterium]|nr:penicillin-binding protein 2 [bacterium]